MEIPAELAIKCPSPEVSPEQIESVCQYLKGKGWVKAAQIEADLSINDRKLRVIIEHSEGRILSGPGCPGYKLFDSRIELIEADLAACRLESQAKAMIRRATSYRVRIHRFAR